MIEGETSQSCDEGLRDRAARLFRFLAELTALRLKKTRDLSSYEAFFWFKDLPHEREIYTHAWGRIDEQEPWLRIDKPQKPPFPEPPEVCRGWFDTSSIEDFDSEPQLASEPDLDSDNPANTSEVVIHQPADASEVYAAWEEYLQQHWRPWKQAMERWERVQQSYRKLFAIHQEQERHGEQYELLVGVGVLEWVDPNNHRIRRPILTANATLSLQPKTGRIELKPPEYGAEIVLEQDMLETEDRPPSDCQTDVEKQARDVASIWERSDVLPILQSWFHSLPIAADGTFSDSLDLTNRPSDAPHMAFAPILILRKRRAHGVVTALTHIEKSIQDGVIIPRGIREVCGEYHDPAGSDGSPTVSQVSHPENEFFPLPSNEEQKAILARLTSRNTVLVQGPPGTGKSHTIVNLVSHFLALGKRVLVTSQTPQALKVLQDKFPPEILPLVVSVLDEKEGPRRNLERSVKGILSAIDAPALDVTTMEKRIAVGLQQRIQLESQLSNLRRRQRETREVDTRKRLFPSTHYGGSPQRIAEALERDVDRFEWFDDDVSESAKLPLNGDELAECFRLREELGPRFDEFVTAQFVNPNTVPAPDAFAQAIRQSKPTFPR